MPNNDLISRTAAIECAIDAVDDWDGGWNPNRETVIRKYFEELPAVDAIPVEWLEARHVEACSEADTDTMNVIRNLINRWRYEQEAR